MGLRIAAGKLDTPITLQRKTVTQDAVYGSIVETWVDIPSSPRLAENIPLRGTEAVEMQKKTSRQGIKLRIRRHAGLSSKDRVLVDSQTADITSVEDHRRKGDMVLWCEIVE